MAVRMMDPQLPMFRAFCTPAVLTPAASEIRTKKVATIEKIIPTPAIIIGNKMADMPLN